MRAADTRTEWGHPLRFERGLVPLVALAASAALHSGFLLAGRPGPGAGKLASPRLRAHRAAFALLVQGSSDERPDEEETRQDSHASVRRPVMRSVMHRRAPERRPVSIPEPKDLSPSELVLARSEYEPSAPPVERVTLAEVERIGGRGRATTEGGVRSPRLLPGLGKPRYPEACRAQGIEGEGEYLLAIHEAGRVTGVRVLKSAGRPEFDKAAKLFFIYKATYEPATLDGVPIPSSMTWKVVFELEFR